MPLDLFFTPIEGDEEVWFGIVLRGLAAKLTEPLHWAIYAAGAWGFWKMRRWMWPWAAVYVAQIAIGTVIWNVTDPRGNGWLGALVGGVFMIPTIALWRSKQTFARPRTFGLTFSWRCACRSARTRPARCACLRRRAGSRRTPSVEP